MYPVLLRIGPISVYSYGLMVALGFLVGIYLAKLEAQRVGVAKEIISDLGLYILVSSIIGARILYVLLNLEYYLSFPQKMIYLNEGGLILYGGLILGGITGFLYVKRKKAPFFKVADTVTPSIAVGEAIGRIGCLLYGCCYGWPTSLPWGVYFSPDSPAYLHYGSQFLHPTQIYSSLTALFIYTILVIKRERVRFEGEVFLTYLILYSMARFIMENLRADNPAFFISLTFSQCLSLVIGLGALIVYLKKRL